MLGVGRRPQFLSRWVSPYLPTSHRVIRAKQEPLCFNDLTSEVATATSIFFLFNRRKSRNPAYIQGDGNWAPHFKGSVKEFAEHFKPQFLRKLSIFIQIVKFICIPLFIIFSHHIVLLSYYEKNLKIQQS